MSHRSLRAEVVMLALVACSKPETPAPPASTTPDWTVSSTAIGTTRFGQPVAEFARAQGTTVDTSVSLTDCEYWKPAGGPAGLGFMVDSGRVVRVDVDSSGTRTAKGIGVGSTITDAEKAYPGMESMPHKYNYDQGWRWLTAWEADSSAAIVFEVDSNVVRNLHAGLAPQVRWVEHCS